MEVAGGGGAAVGAAVVGAAVGGKLVKGGRRLLVTGGTLVIGGEAFPSNMSTTSYNASPTVQTREIFKTARRLDTQPPLTRITVFNTFTSSTTHLNHPQTVPVPGMAATLR